MIWAFMKMVYLSKNKRKQQIIESAIKLVLSEGLNALSVRKLAEKAKFSVSQIHYHFDSIHDLKSQVFLKLVH
jgi:AcrR family transcriptional regulator